jgi:hypothetical protein
MTQFIGHLKDVKLSTSDDGDVAVKVDSEGGISFNMPVLIDNIFFHGRHEALIQQ